MINVTAAEHIILKTAKGYGAETISLEQATGRVLAEEVTADRALPPYNRVTMDGIAISYKPYEKGQRSFPVKGTQAAGGDPIEVGEEECIEIMTGAALPKTADTIIRYEDVTIEKGTATINIDTVKKGQNIHYAGTDIREHELLIPPDTVLTPAHVNTLASVGKVRLLVKKLPKIVVISTGEELVSVEDKPTPFQVRRSNNYAIASVLKEYCITSHMLHVKDDKDAVVAMLSKCMNEYDVLILSGGVSMGKYDYLPEAFKELHVQELLHKVRQRPGKPMWFGMNPDYKHIFAFPGNPVSAFMCMYRYFIPWLAKSLGLEDAKPVYAVLEKDYEFKPELQYFLQVKISGDKNGTLVATPHEGNGSGDFVNLLHTDAFMELPEERSVFKKGEAYRIWPFKNISSWIN